MGDAQRFRKRARECRQLSKLARDGHSRQMLGALAIELDEEADKLDAEEMAKTSTRH